MESHPWEPFEIKSSEKKEKKDRNKFKTLDPSKAGISRTFVKPEIVSWSINVVTIIVFSRLLINFSYGKLIILKSETAVRKFQRHITYIVSTFENRELRAIFLRYYALTETRIEVVEKHEQ